MGQITDIQALTKELQKEKITLIEKVKELKEKMETIEKQIRYYEGAEDSIDVTLKMICENGNNKVNTIKVNNDATSQKKTTRRGWKTTRKTDKNEDQKNEELD